MKKATILTFLLFGLLTTPGVSQRESTRSGFWVGLGLGSGSTSLDCASNCSTENVGGWTGYGRAGYTITRRILVGFEGIGWTNSREGVTERVGFASLTALIYPVKTGGYFLKVGAGAMRYTIHDNGDDLEANSTGLSVGFGYDLRIASNWSVTPHVMWLTGKANTYHLNGADITNAPSITLSLLEFGVGLTWH